MKNYKDKVVKRIFSSPYPDELLYSIIARFHFVRGNVKYWQTMEELFDDKRAISSVDIPQKMNQFKSFGLNVTQLLMHNTQYPFYCAFMPKKVFDNVQRRLYANDGNRIASVGHVKTFEFLHFCPECVNEELEKYGEAYWHRLHQTPGVFTCEKHRCILVQSSIEIVKHKKEYLPVITQNLYPAMPIQCTDQELKLMYQLTDDIKYLYDNYNFVRQAFLNSEDNFKSSYLWLCKERGLTTKNGSLYQKKLLDSFCDYFSDGFLKRIGLSMDVKYKPWIVSMFRHYKTSVVTSNPLKYILLAEFLCGSFKNFMENFIAKKIENKSQNTHKTTYADIEKIKKYRKLWIDASKTSESKYLKDVRKRAEYVYTWLLRHDKIWLKKHSVIVGAKGGSITDIDWVKKDNHNVIILQHAVKSLLGNKKEIIQLTKRSIYRQAKITEIRKDHFVYFPKTIAFIENNVESKEEFRLRKMGIIVERLIQSNAPIVKWKVAREASIPYKLVDEYWEKFLEKNMTIEKAQ